MDSVQIKVGLVGTGYAAKQRAIALQKDSRSQLVAVVGHTPASTQSFSKIHQVPALDSWQALIQRPDIQLIMISNANAAHGALTHAALQANKHVVVEYPLAFAPQEAANLIDLAKARHRLLHVEHIELLGGIHQASRQYLADIGPIVYARYSTIAPQHPAPQRWTYQPSLFGFPFKAALPRLHRFIDLLGPVATVSCQTRFWPSPHLSYFRACLCQAQLRFVQGAIAEITYGKGDIFDRSERTLTLQGEKGLLVFESQQGKLIQHNQEKPIEMVNRRGLFARDTQMVINYLKAGEPMYVEPTSSLYALQVADAAEYSAKTGTTVKISAHPGTSGSQAIVARANQYRGRDLGRGVDRGGVRG